MLDAEENAAFSGIDALAAEVSIAPKHRSAVFVRAALALVTRRELGPPAAIDLQGVTAFGIKCKNASRNRPVEMNSAAVREYIVHQHESPCPYGRRGGGSL